MLVCPTLVLYVSFAKVFSRISCGLVREVDRKFGCNLVLNVYSESCKESLILISVRTICVLLYAVFKLK